MSLGVWSFPLGAVAAVWLSVVTVLLLLPTSYPVTSSSMNYSIAVVGAVVLLGLLNWELNSKHVFTGPPRINGKLAVTFQDEDSQGIEGSRETEPLVVKNIL